MPEEAATRVRSMIATLLAQPEPGILIIEHQATYQDGSLHWQEWSNRTIRDANGQVIELQGIGHDITERKRAEEALRASEARFRTAFASAAVGMVLVGLDGHPLEVNRAIVEMLGYSEDEMRARTFADITVPDDLEPNLTLFREAVAGARESYEVEKRYRHQDGHVVWAHLSAGVVRDATGTPSYVLAHVQDITARKTLECEQARLLAAERDARQRLETVLEVLPAGVIIADAQGQLIHVNQAFRETWGEPALAGGMGIGVGMGEDRLFRGWHPDGRPMVTEDWAMTRALQQGATVRGQEVEIEAFDGTRKTILNHAAPLRDGEGHSVGSVGAFVDITERKELERAHTLSTLLGSLTQAFQTLAEHSPDYIARLDPFGRLLYINRAGAEQLGLPAEQWIGKSLVDVGLPPEVAAGWGESLQEVMATRMPRTFDAAVSTPNGEAHSLHIRCVPEFAEDSTLQSVLAIATDISALKQAEARLAEQASQLEATFAAMSDGVAVYAKDRRLVQANQAWQAMFHHIAEVRGRRGDPARAARPFAEQAEEIDWQAALDAAGQVIPVEALPASRALQGETVAGQDAVDERFEAPDGRVFEVSVTAAPIRDASGQVTSAVVVGRDVTARRALERQKRELARELETILDASPDAIGVVDPQGCLVRSNRGLRERIARLAGLDFEAFASLSPPARAEALGLRDEQGRTVAVDALPDVRALGGEVLADQTTVDVWMRGPNGHGVVANVAAAPVYDVEGRVIVGSHRLA